VVFPSPTPHGDIEIAPSRQSRFHLEATALLLRAVPASVSVSCLGAENERFHCCLRYHHHYGRFAPPLSILDLLALAPMDRQELLSGNRHAFRLSDLDPAARRSSLDLIDEGSHALLVFLHSQGRFHGLLGLERVGSEPDFSHEEQQIVEDLAVVMSLAAGLWVDSESLACENAALRRLSTGARDSEGGTGEVVDGLSSRERQVAELLIEGYANVNVAAVLGLSENTIRTYVRRLYRKLGVYSRLELARAMSRLQVHS
jgi:DNA-binding CsgD family transcriptional regulator